jgi:hypothetical protein
MFKIPLCYGNGFDIPFCLSKLSELVIASASPAIIVGDRCLQASLCVCVTGIALPSNLFIINALFQL